MSGHSKWSTIKRQKGAADAKRGQLFTKLAREISIAARQGLQLPERAGGPALGREAGAFERAEDAAQPEGSGPQLPAGQVRTALAPARPAGASACTEHSCCSA